MPSAKGRGRSRKREAAFTADNDRAWASIFAIVIIAGLALAALFFYMNRGNQTPARHSSLQEAAPPTSTPTSRK